MQFGDSVRDVLSGDPDQSVRLRRPVSEAIGFRYVNTLILTGAALLIGIVVGVPAGAASWNSPSRRSSGTISR